MKHHVVFLDRGSLKTEIRKLRFEHTYKEYHKTSFSQIVPRLKQATIAIINKVQLNEEMLVKLPKLEMVAIAATGYDCADITACKNYGVALTNIRNYAIHTVPEHVFMLILSLRRNLIAYRRDVENGLWQKSDKFFLSTHNICDLYGSTMGIIGKGAIGKATAEIARGFGMHVIFSNYRSPIKKNSVGSAPLEMVLAKSDILSLHCPMTPETRGMIGINELRTMKRNALLINTARGGLVNEKELLQALDEGLIAGAGFDVLTTEPPTSTHPLLNMQRPNFILTPHVAWTSDTAMKSLAEQLVDNIESWVTGNPQNLVP
ncbi:MAG: glycerate dehydrogenase [Nitrosomonadaceae bacterium]|nr:glycerate dehydrogenase [Nitrosomonadaceae bacterium]|tara:strand:- start:11990 stop:12943 length:954 start_codon:yes stop_codon:yes gene_type:complete